jgi:hypothetical protein
MHPFWYNTLFHKAGKPRGWTRVVLFHKDGTTRPLFYRVTHKKSGAVRPHWAYWAASTGASEGPRQGILSSSHHESELLSASEKALLQLRNFDQTVADWQRTEPLPELLSAEAIVDLLAALASPPANIVLSASHDNYRVNPGGVQLCIQREEKAAIARGFAYLQFHPWQPVPCLAPVSTGDDLPVTMLLNGTPIGTATMATLTTAVEKCVMAGSEVRLIVHHLLGHSPEALTALAQTAKVREVPFWLHDFFALCPSYTLQRNGLTFCGAPDEKSNACGLCVFGPARPLHQTRIANFFRSLPVIAVAPSQVTADFWSTKSSLPVQGLAVIPHVVLEERPRTFPELLEASAPITVGYLGAAVAHKGWPIFTEMMNRHSGPRMRFVVLSTERPGLGEDAWHRVHVTSETPNAMSLTVERSKVDIVLHWASWPETFSFTTFEALAAGAWVLTNPVSGNVQAAVRATGRGAVLDDQEALDCVFANGSLAKLVAERRSVVAKTEIHAHYSSITFDLPEWS